MPKFFAAAALAVLIFVALQQPAGALDSTHAEMYCQRDGAKGVEIRWSGYDRNALNQWIDISYTNNGFLPGTFKGFEYRPYQGEAYIINLLANETLYFRVNQQHRNGGWDTSITYMINTGAACPQPRPAAPSSPSYYSANDYYDPRNDRNDRYYEDDRRYDCQRWNECAPDDRDERYDRYDPWRDLDCSDVGGSGGGGFWVGDNDPHGFDGDGDGWGCE